MPRHILVADDSATIRKAIELTFAREDVRITQVATVEEAMVAAQHDLPDIVLADAKMEQRTGYDLCSELKSDKALAQVPVLILSGSHSPYDEARGQKVGAIGHVSKPFDSQVLIDKVNAVFRNKLGADAPATGVPPVRVAEPARPREQAHTKARGSTHGTASHAAAPHAAAPVTPPPAAAAAPVAPPAPAPVTPPPPAGAPPPAMRDLGLGRAPMIGRPVAPPRKGAPSRPPAAEPKPILVGEAKPAPVKSAKPKGSTLSPGVASPPVENAAPAAHAAPAPASPAPHAAPAPAASAPAARVADKVADKIAQLANAGPEYAAIAKLSRDVIEKIAWEVVPELAEMIIRGELDRLTKTKEQ
jgi:CheY-like chemotaxis protein